MYADGPVLTRELLMRQFTALGVRPGDVVLVNSSLRSIGWVLGGATTVVRALLDAVGPLGTVAVPAQTPDNRDPSIWFHRPLPEEAWPIVRAHLPAFDPALSPSEGMGAIAERVRTWPGAARSAHPLTSFAAVGGEAAELMAEHELESMLGDHSPLAAMERAHAKVLLLGVDFGKCTAFHLGESRVPGLRVYEMSAPMRTKAGRAWVRYETAVLDDRDFADLGAAYEAACAGDRSFSRGMIGAASSRLFPLRGAVRFAESWLAPRRPPAAPSSRAEASGPRPGHRPAPAPDEGPVADTTATPVKARNDDAAPYRPDDRDRPRPNTGPSAGGARRPARGR
jgi:aminoglycoside 3-N-acetyltransferase